MSGWVCAPSLTPLSKTTPTHSVQSPASATSWSQQHQHQQQPQHFRLVFDYLLFFLCVLCLSAPACCDTPVILFKNHTRANVTTDLPHFDLSPGPLPPVPLINQTGLNKTEFEFYLEEVEYYHIWAAISSSLANWHQRKLERQNRTNVETSASKSKRSTAAERVETTTTATAAAAGSAKSRRRRDEESVCYHNFGCFRDEGPFDYLDTLPASPESISTTFMLYTKRNPSEGQRLDYDNSSTLLASNFNASNDVKIIIHGFGSSSKRPWVLQMTEALLYVDDFNVISVDWENGSRLPNYVQAAGKLTTAGSEHVG